MVIKRIGNMWRKTQIWDMIIIIIHDTNATIHVSLVAILNIFIVFETHTYNGGYLQHYK